MTEGALSWYCFYTQVKKVNSVITEIVSFLDHTKYLNLNLNLSQVVFKINLQQYRHVNLQSYVTPGKNITK